MKKKIAFETYEEARAELERIVSTWHKPWKKEHKKPTRIFLDPRDNLYYLTSKPKLTEY